MRKRTFGPGHRALWVAAAACALAWRPAAAAPLYDFTALGIASAVATSARALNDAGQVAGSATTSDGSDAALWSGATGALLRRPDGALGSTGYAINAAGQVAGSIYTGMGRYSNQAAVWSGSAVTTIDSMYLAAGINAAGQVVGNGPARSFFQGPLSWSAGVTKELGASGGVIGDAVAINDAGHIVGFNGDAAEQGRATLWRGGDVVDLGVFGVALAINAQGLVAGTSWEGQGARAFLWGAIGLRWLDAPGADLAWAYGINDQGQVVGDGAFAGEMRALLWSDGAAHDLNALLAPCALAPDWVLRSAYDINNNGWIVGDARNARTGQTSAFLLTPQDANAVPEPQSAALVGLALAAVWALRRRRPEAGTVAAR